MDTLGFHDVEIGDEWESPARTVTETDIVQFACLTGDFNPLHMDHEFARRTPFGRPIAHGLLGLSLVAGLANHFPTMRTLAFVRIVDWQFQKPILVGDTVHVLSVVIGKEERARGRRGLIRWSKRLINQDGEIVQEGITETLVEGHTKPGGLTPPPQA
jgi:acyl dehydratase